MTRTVLCLPVIALLACGGSGNEFALAPGGVRIIESGITIFLDRDSYRPAGLIGVQLVNRTNRSFGYNLCFRGFERREGNAWVAQPPELRLCTMQLDGLGAGQTRSGTTDMAADAQPGTYRMLVSFGSEDGVQVVAVSAAFTVQ